MRNSKIGRRTLSAAADTGGGQAPLLQRMAYYLGMQFVRVFREQAKGDVAVKIEVLELGNRHYSEIWAVLMVANSLIGGGLYSSIGLFYDKFGSYRGTFFMASFLYLGALVLGAAAVRMSKRQRERLFAKPAR